MAITRDARLSKPSKSDGGLEALGVPREGGALYELALTHRSFAFEQDDWGGHNERLEFLGDAILEAVVTSLIYKRYPDLAEGEMARLRAAVVETKALAQTARELGVGAHVRLGKGEEASGGRDKPSILANVFEALIGAVFVELGMPAVEAALVPLFTRKLEAAATAGRFDTKTALQEVAVKETGDLPTYRVSSSGPDHDKRFIAHVYIGNDLFGTGSGRSKKDAEQDAAREALGRLEGATPTAGGIVVEGGADARAS